MNKLSILIISVLLLSMFSGCIQQSPIFPDRVFQGYTYKESTEKITDEKATEHLEDQGNYVMNRFEEKCRENDINIIEVNATSIIKRK